MIKVIQTYYHSDIKLHYIIYNFGTIQVNLSQFNS
jgi:hypothetical protein